MCRATVPVLGLAEPRFAEPRAAERSDDARQEGDGRHYIFLTSLVALKGVVAGLFVFVHD